MRIARFLLCCLSLTALPLRGQEPAVETGKFRIFAFHKPQIEETYRIERNRDSVVMNARSEWLRKAFPGVPQSREILLRMRSDLTPERLEATVSSTPKPEISFAVEINGDVASVREGNSTRQAKISSNAFPIADAESMSLQMMLVRYWVKHGKPNVIPIIP